MPTSHDDYKKKLPPARRTRIEARAKELIAEELTLRELRKARQLSQETLAELLEMRQGDLSKMERRTDAYLSTIRRFVEAMGGKLDLIVSFPNSRPVKIVNIGKPEELESKRKTRKRSQRVPSGKRLTVGRKRAK